MKNLVHEGRNIQEKFSKNGMKSQKKNALSEYAVSFDNMNIPLDSCKKLQKGMDEWSRQISSMMKDLMEATTKFKNGVTKKDRNAVNDARKTITKLAKSIDKMASGDNPNAQYAKKAAQDVDFSFGEGWNDLAEGKL